MKIFVALCASLLALSGLKSISHAAEETPIMPRLTYPATRQSEQADTYHGITVRDPYRWLEDANSAETRQWVEAQNKVSFSFLASIPERARIQARLTELWNYEKFGLPSKQGGRYFYNYNSGLQNQSVLYTAGTLESKARVLLDPNTLAKDGTVAVTGTAVTDDGKYLAYGTSVAGSDWQEFRVREIATGNDLPDVVKWVKFSGASWTKDGKGFFYSRFDEPRPGEALQQQNFYQKLYYHRLGTPQSEDRLIYQRPDQKDLGINGSVSEDGRYLILSVMQRGIVNNRIFFWDLQNPKTPVLPNDSSAMVGLLTQNDAQYSFLGNAGPVFWFLTDKDAPMKRVVAVDIRKPDPENWRTLIPESADKLNSVSVVGNRFFASYLKDARSQVLMFDLKGKSLGEVDLPGIGSVSGFGGKRRDKETFYSFSTFTAPPTLYRYDIATGKSSVYRAAKVAYNPSDYETKQVFYSSKDGTRIPMFLVYKKGLAQNGQNPTYLYGYGGFQISLTPSFSPALLTWMEMGGIYAVPNLRGGGEYGKAWHDAGRKLKKQNVFDDFIAAGEWLISNGYTSKTRLAIGGGSNGGLLVGACMTQRPDLFAAALPSVGVMDMLRFHKFTIGYAWTTDYGSPDNPEEFKALYAYSPLHNLKPGTKYPATLVTTSDHDDRVVPAHSYKFAAALQAAHGGDKPALIRIETQAGHGSGKPTAKVIEEAADRWAFLVRVLEMSLPASYGSK
jgi:prolyl oligopeptidase